MIETTAHERAHERAAVARGLLATLDAQAAHARTLVLVAATKFADGWPEHDTPKVSTRYAPLATALSATYRTDAHFPAYSVPRVPRRLATDDVYAALAAKGIDGVTMVMLIVDIDGAGHAATVEWRLAERAKIEQLFEDHPGGYVYATRGGYRIVYVLAVPHVLRSRRDAERWRAWYGATLAYLREHYGIDGDLACDDWTRLYRLPHTTRDGEIQDHGVIGHATAIGAWDVEVVVPELEPVRERAAPSGVVSKPGASCEELVRAWYPGVQGKPDSGGTRYDIPCPWEHEHTTRSRRSSSVWIAASGAAAYTCLHGHCRNVRAWDDLHRFHEPDWKPYDERDHTRRANRVPNECDLHDEDTMGEDDDRPIDDDRDAPHPAETAEPPDEVRARRERKRKPKASGPLEVGQSAHPGLGPDGGYRLTELGNARRFADLHHSQIRYVPAWKKWVVWDEQRWKRDELDAASAAAKQVVAAIYADAAIAAQRAAGAATADGFVTTESAAGAGIAESLAKHARSSGKRAAIDNMIALARSEDGIVTAPDVFDRDHFALNVANGTIDLRDGEMRPHRQTDMITMRAPVTYDANARAPQWEHFLERVLPDANVRAWVQRFLGYALTGDTREQCLAFFVGGGANGKSVLVDVVLAILGDYGLRAAPDLVLAKQGEAHPTDLADLESRRLVVCSEIEQGRQWAESVIKRITGDTTITARRMREDFHSFAATHKLVVAANTRPTVRGTDFGIWRRMRLVPWDVTIPISEQDRTLPQRLLATEASGILAWLVRGCLAWQRAGLGAADAIEVATAKYRDDQDTLGRWIEDRCDLGDVWCATADLYASYKAWAEVEGIAHPWTRRTWRDRMLERPGIGESVREHGRTRVLTGIETRRTP